MDTAAVPVRALAQEEAACDSESVVAASLVSAASGLRGPTTTIMSAGPLSLVSTETRGVSVAVSSSISCLALSEPLVSAAPRPSPSTPLPSVETVLPRRPASCPE